MTTISQIQSVTRASSSSTTQQSAGATGNFDTFLKLLVAQIKNQDPTKPMDPTQTVTQLATFSSVEQAIQTNTLLTSLNNNTALSQASALVGRMATSADGSTSGVVKSVTLADTGLVATLANGKQIAIGSGVTIS
jgi:flagellar basal-body rod modification protein FlgD